MLYLKLKMVSGRRIGGLAVLLALLLFPREAHVSTYGSITLKAEFFVIEAETTFSSEDDPAGERGELDVWKKRAAAFLEKLKKRLEKDLERYKAERGDLPLVKYGGKTPRLWAESVDPADIGRFI